MSSLECIKCSKTCQITEFCDYKFKLCLPCEIKFYDFVINKDREDLSFINKIMARTGFKTFWDINKPELLIAIDDFLEQE